MPLPPEPAEPTDWEHYTLWRGVRDALYACPAHFSTPTFIDGLLATDVFTLNTPLAATIEESVVKTLNNLRTVWDPDGKYETFSFVRQPQTFPDVVLRKWDNGADILMGVELKGWYLLAKEKKPTFRFTVTEAACNHWDLLAVVPWVLSNVLAGTPELHRPFVQTARYCAQKRNYHWMYERQVKGERGEIIEPTGIEPYPVKSDPISDTVTKDGGRNFGRLARYGIMDDYIGQMQQTLIRGIPVRDWQAFFNRADPQDAKTKKDKR